MAKSPPVDILAFNRGVVSADMMARVDVPRLALSAETQTNLIPKPLGPALFRPGTKYIGGTESNNPTRHIPFIYSNSDTAIVELTDYLMRVYVSDTIVTRTAVSTAFTNGTFNSDLTGWTDADEGGTAASSWLTGGYMSLLGDGTNAALRKQTLTIAGGDQSVEHAIDVNVARGPVTVRIGSSDGDDDYLTETKLETGYHSLVFTPTGASAYVQVLSREEYPCLLDSIAIGSSGDMTLTTPWPEAFLGRIRFEQSGDVIFVTCAGVRMSEIRRYASGSWGVIDHPANKGPFRDANLTNITITPSALTGLITLTASKPIFKSTHVGALFKVTSDGQTVTQSVSADNTFTNNIKVTGTGKERVIGVTVTGSFTATVTLQRSLDEASWEDVVSYTGTQAVTLTDSLDDQVWYYRIGVKSGSYTSGTAVCTLTYMAGSITGIARVSAFTSSTVVSAYVLSDMGSTGAQDDWCEGAWSDYRGHPSACAINDGRLFTVGLDKIWGSVSDDYNNHDIDTVGDSGPIARTIGTGPVDTLRWLKGSPYLIAGGDGAEFLARASNEDSIMTPSSFTLRPKTTVGSHTTEAVTVDDSIVFIDKSGTRVRQLYSDGSNFKTIDLTMLAPAICEPSVSSIAVQRLPETRIHCVLSDGTVAILCHSDVEGDRAWVKFETDGTVEEVFVLPGAVEDAVYYVVQRTINSATVRYLEKWALESEVVGGQANKQADSFVYYSGSATTTITGLGHLEAETVVVWADGAPVSNATVSSGQITLSTAASEVVVGMSYTWAFKSTRLARAPLDLIHKSRVTRLGLVAVNTHESGIQFGPDASNLRDLPEIEAGAAVTDDSIWSAYNYEYIEFPGDWAADNRLYLTGSAPKPAKLLAAVMEIERGR